MVAKKMEMLGRHRSVIREIFTYAQARRAEIGEENVFDFSLGNPSVDAPAIVTDTLLSLIRENGPAALHGYTAAQGDGGVREAIAADIRARYACPADADDLYLTVGAAAALTISLHALLSGGEEVIVFAPYFPEYRVFVEAAGGTLVTVPCDAPRFIPSPDALRAAITEKTAAVILNSPNNPTGAVLSKDEAAALCAVLCEAEEKYGHEIYLIADEPYRELVYTEEIPPYLPTLYNDTLVCYSFSKSLSLPGERIGYILVSPTAREREALRAAVAGAGRALGYVCAPALFQKMLPAVLGKTADIEIYRHNRDRLYTALTDYGFTCVPPDGAFYLFVAAPNGDATAFAETAKKHELLLVPSDSFGCTGYVRIAYCVTPEMIERALPAFRALAEDYQLGE